MRVGAGKMQVEIEVVDTHTNRFADDDQFAFELGDVHADTTRREPLLQYSIAGVRSLERVVRQGGL